MTGRNRFAPPVNRSVEAPAEARHDAIRRPISAWMLMVLLAILALGILAAVGWSGWWIARSSHQVRSPIVLLTGVLVRVLVVAAIVWLALSIHRAKAWSRWAGLAAIVAVAAFSVFRPADGADYPNDAQRAGAMLGRYIIWPILCAYWAYGFAFTEKARRYFARRSLDLE